jgi:hypothetical protein
MISFQNADSDFFSFETLVRLWRLLSLDLQFFFSFFDLALSKLNLVLRFFYPPFLVPAYAPDPGTGGDVQGYAQGPARGEGVYLSTRSRGSIKSRGNLDLNWQ